MEGKDQELIMRLSEKALATVGGVLWGGGMLFVSLVNVAIPAYGMEFLNVMSSVYPGFHATHTLRDALVAPMYGLVDGAIGGYLLGLLYNWFARPVPHECVSTGQTKYAA